jgi:chaperonin cofactor prefoldin
MATYEPDDKKELETLNRQLETAKKQTSDRSDKVDDLTSRFRELRRRNHFRLMLEEIFHD